MKSPVWFAVTGQGVINRFCAPAWMNENCVGQRPEGKEMIRTTLIARGMIAIGLLAAAPASADGPTSTVSCSPPARCIIKQTITNYASLPGLAIATYPSVPSQAINNYRNLPNQIAAN